jgi:hypothetical protein
MDSQIMELGAEDHAHEFEWIEGKLYWLDMHYEPYYDPDTTAHAILMVHET